MLSVIKMLMAVIASNESFAGIEWSNNRLLFLPSSGLLYIYRHLYNITIAFINYTQRIKTYLSMTYSGI